jgi:hypothetical protein
LRGLCSTLWDAIRHLIRDNHQWWSTDGIILGEQKDEGAAGETEFFGAGLGPDALEEAIKSTSRRPSVPSSHKVNPLIPFEIDDPLDALHFAEDLLFDLQWLSQLVVGVPAAIEAYALRYSYSPRARYYNRYTPLLEHITAGHSIWLNQSAKGDTKGALLRHSAKHVVIPFVSGQCGSPTKASLEAATMLLCEDTKSPRAAENLCVKAMWIAMDSAIKMYAQWF